MQGLRSIPAGQTASVYFRVDGKRSSLTKLIIEINIEYCQLSCYRPRPWGSSFTLMSKGVILNAFRATVTFPFGLFFVFSALSCNNAIASACAKVGVRRISPESPHRTRINSRPCPTIGIFWVVYIYTYTKTYTYIYTILYASLHATVRLPGLTLSLPAGNFFSPQPVKADGCPPESGSAQGSWHWGVCAGTVVSCGLWMKDQFFFSFFLFWIKVEWLICWCTSYSMLNPLCWSAVNADTWSGNFVTGIALLKHSKGGGHVTVWSSSLKLISQIDWHNFKVWHELPNGCHLIRTIVSNQLKFSRTCFFL